MRTIFAAGHIEAPAVTLERQRLRDRVAVAEERYSQYGGHGYEISLGIAQRALDQFEQQHPAHHHTT